MRPESHVSLTPRMEEAVQELKGVITKRFPQATFVVEEGSDPKGIYLVTTVDITDTDEIIDLVGDRLVELQVVEGLTLYLTPLRTIIRVVSVLTTRVAIIAQAPRPYRYGASSLYTDDYAILSDR